MSIALLIAINPPEDVTENIERARKLIAKKTGRNIYGSHDPHITLVVNTFSKFSDVEKEITSIVKKNKPFMARIEGLHQFPLDPIFKTNTIVYKVEKTLPLATIQKDCISALNPMRTDDQVQWILKQNPNPPKENMKNINKYGYPYGPEDWFFHATIGSVSKEDYDEHYATIWKQIQPYDINTTWEVTHIAIYILLGEDGFKLFRKYKLQG